MTASSSLPNKVDWRKRLLTSRKSISSQERAADSRELCHGVTTLAIGRSCIAAYVPIGTEPGNTTMLDALTAAGVRVLLPITSGLGPLSWAVYEGADSLVDASFGLREPGGIVCAPDELAVCDAILVPALAIDRRGVRLGRGAGYYDRSLHLASPDALLVGVVRDDELVPELPEEPHDRRLTHALTPRRGLVPLATE